MAYDLSIIVPVFNEAGNIKELIARTVKAMGKTSMSYQLIFVDDKSEDNTLEEIKKNSKDIPITIHIKRGEKGKAFSILEGVKLAKADYIAMIDGDLQYPPEAIVQMYKLAKKYGVAVARRRNAKTTFSRKIGSKINTFIFGKILLGLKCDPQSGLKVFKKEIIDHLEKNNITKWTLDMPLLKTATDLGYEIANFDITFEERKVGESKVNFTKTSFEIAKQAISLKFKKRKVYEIKPDSPHSMIGAGVIHKRKRFITHTTLAHNQSAMIPFEKWQKIFIIALTLLLIVGTLTNIISTLTILIAILSIIYFADMYFNIYVLSKALGKTTEMKFNPHELENLKDIDLPVYSILCPLYKEAKVLPHFIKSIETLDWPKNKLDVLLLLEENDEETIAAAKRLDLPKYIRTVMVPHTFPKTKPKACNYGLNMAKGEYITIYDAEDQPDPLQLKKAYLGFQIVGPKVFCLQSKLNYYNPHQNFITRLFTAEYSLWFDLTLPGLQSIETAIPLGGTSNHFRTNDLKTLKGWDPFNVTEDCDLGVRLFRAGYKTAIIDSTTYEEANSNVGNWIRQRSRWIKGYLQTYLVHTRKPIKLIKENGIHALILQLIIGMRVSFILINPFLWLATISYFTFHKYVGATISTLYPTPVFYIAVVSLIFGNFTALYSYMIGLAKRDQWNLIKYVFLVPFYWIITSIAAYIAFYQLIFKPHYWEKTNHGLNLKDAIKNPQTLTKEETKKETSIIRDFTKSDILNGSFLVIASLTTNFFNFLYNSYLGRTLTPGEFGVIGLLGSFMYITQIPSTGISKTVVYKSAGLLGKYNTPIKSYWAKIRKRVFLIAIIISGTWLLAVNPLSKTFHTPILPLILFAPVWFIGFVGAVDGGFLSGNLFFLILGITAITESLTKLVLSFAFLKIGRSDLVYAAVPISMATTFLISYIAILLMKTKENQIKVQNIKLDFSKKFFSASILAKIASIAFLSLDVILAKTYLSENEAGQYALLSLTGSMIFFFGTLFSQFITPIISKHEGAGKDSSKVFNKLMFVTIAASLFAFFFVGILGKFTIPLLLGPKTKIIIPYLIPYGLSMVYFTVAVNIVSYHQIKNHYLFPILSFLLSLVQMTITIVFHQNITTFVSIMFGMSFVNLVIFSIFHHSYDSIKVALGNITDFLGLFSYPKTRDKNENNLKILIFNWRDTKHVWAGGAENYLHELARRWVRDGNTVTIFCGNDGQSPKFENVDGVNIVRRGGFYTVYFWAFIYYITRLRGKFDIVIDSENGIPFFTPLFVFVPKILVIYHIHQDVFRKHLTFPLNRFAMFIEKNLVPSLYKGQKIVTISKSSKDGIKEINFEHDGEIEIINPGVNLDLFKPSKKTKYPSVIYLGRLMHYKNVDVVIEAFSKVVKKYNDSKFLIAGYGESREKLEDLVKDLKLENNVEFLGKVSEEEKVRLLGQSWISVQPSSAEGWGMTIIEANACGTPVIASNISGLKDSVIDGKTGILIPAKNSKAFSKAILNLIENKKYLDELSKEAVNWSQNFDWEKSSEKFLSTIKNHHNKGLNLKLALEEL